MPPEGRVLLSQRRGWLHGLWPFGRANDGGDVEHPTSLSACVARSGPTRVRCEVTVASGSDVASPLSGSRGAAIVIELLERLTPQELEGEDGGVVPAEVIRYHPLRTVQLGAALILRGNDGVEVTVSAPHVAFVFATASPTVTPLAAIPPELGASEGNGRSRFFREQIVRPGDRFRLDATVEATSVAVGSGYRSGARTEIAVRAHLSPVSLEEILDTPEW